jgi:hypothetical protein
MAIPKISLQFPKMRKAQDFVIYPFSATDTHFIVQADNYIGRFDVETGEGIYARASNRTQMYASGKALKLSADTLKDIRTLIMNTSNRVIPGLLTIDNSGADKLRELYPHKNHEDIEPFNEMLANVKVIPYDTAFHKWPSDATEFGVDGIEVHPVRFFNDKQDDNAVEQCEAAEAHFWSVYLHVPGMGLRCIADASTPEIAERIKTALENFLNCMV